MRERKFSSPPERAAFDDQLAARAHLDDTEACAGDARGDLGCFLHVVGFNQVKPGDHFFRLGKWTIGDVERPAPRGHASRLLRRRERFRDDEIAGFPKTIVEIQVPSVQFAGIPRRHRGQLALVQMDQAKVLHGGNIPGVVCGPEGGA